MRRTAPYLEHPVMGCVATQAGSQTVGAPSWAPPRSHQGTAQARRSPFTIPDTETILAS